MIRDQKKTPVQQFSEDIKSLLREVLDEENVWQTCLHCVSFNEQTELCSKCNPPARPPARVITFGCPQFCDTAETVSASEPEPELKKKASVWPFEELEDDIPF